MKKNNYALMVHNLKAVINDDRKTTGCTSRRSDSFHRNNGKAVCDLFKKLRAEEQLENNGFNR